MKTFIEKHDYPNLGDYKIISQLGVGGFGKVYRATNSQNEDVIIKLIESDRIWSKLILNRKRILSCCSNHTPQIFDVLTINGYNCIVEEFIDGESLEEIIPSNKLKFCDFFTIIKNIIDALQVLYSHDLVYGDLKPSNIIIKKDVTKAYLIDIDSAFIHEHGTSKFFGTLVFAAPEQILENSLTTYADIYSLGILMYNLLENRTPFDMDKHGMLDKVNGNVNFSLLNVSEVSFKKRLQALIEKMTHKDKNHRMNIDDVINEIDELEKIAEKNNELDYSLRINDPSTHLSNEDFYKNIDIRTFFITAALTSRMIIDPLRCISSSVDLENFYAYTDLDNAVIKTNKNSTCEEASSNSHAYESYYRKQLIEEYAQINKQAIVSFWLWVSTFIVGFLIITIAVIMTILGHFTEAIITVILEALVYFVQRLFSIREDYYRKQNSDKLKHLESGDYYDYIMEILNTTREDFREKRIDSLIKSIQKQIENNSNDT